jgi:hypothetical protein
LYDLASRLPNPTNPLCTSGPRRQSDVVLQLQSRFRITFTRLESYAQLVFDGKHTVIGEVFAVFVENLCGEMLVAFVADYEVDVCGAEGVAVHHLQEMSCGAIVGDLENVRSSWGYCTMEQPDRVRSRSQAVQRVSAILVRHELTAEVQIALVRVLLLVESCRVLST